MTFGNLAGLGEYIASNPLRRRKFNSQYMVFADLPPLRDLKFLGWFEVSNIGEIEVLHIIILKIYEGMCH